MKNQSHKTAIRRKRPSAPIGWLFNSGIFSLWEFGKKTVLDYGCGHGTDADYFGMEKYDPHFYPVRPKGKFKTVFCTYVLNVIPKSEEEAVLEDIKSLLLKGGRAYVTVRRDIKGVVRTSKGTYQRNVKLKYPVVKETSAYCIYEVCK